MPHVLRFLKKHLFQHLPILACKANDGGLSSLYRVEKQSLIYNTNQPNICIYNNFIEIIYCNESFLTYTTLIEIG